MSTTRLIVLGAVRIFQPAHGYQVRRELLSWEVDRWGNVNPGSIYHALQSLTRDGLLRPAETGADGGRPARTSYELTPDGEQRFLSLLRQALWTVDEQDPTAVLAGLNFMWALPRAEVRDALRARGRALQNRVSALGHALLDVERNRRVPAHVRELQELTRDRFAAELRWVRRAAERIDQGAYHFADEPGEYVPDAQGRWGPMMPTGQDG